MMCIENAKEVLFVRMRERERDMNERVYENVRGRNSDVKEMGERCVS